jgi:hypothetical protein
VYLLYVKGGQGGGRHAAFIKLNTVTVDSCALSVVFYLCHRRFHTQIYCQGCILSVRTAVVFCSHDSHSTSCQILMSLARTIV